MVKGLSIHIGVTAVDIDTFGDLGTLEGCDEDAKAMANLAKNQRFQGIDPVTHAIVDTPLPLLNAEATKKTILGLMEAASKQLASGDIFLMTYSGHGGQVKKEDLSDVSDGGKDGDGEDEFLCPFDQALLDDELRVMWRTFKPNVRIVLVTDCCHSGTVADLADSGGDTSMSMTPAARAEGSEGGGTAVLVNANPKGLSRDKVREVIRRQRQLFTQPKQRPQIEALIIALAACADNETTPDGLPNGAFTTQLLRTWNKGEFKGTHGELLAEVAKKFEPRQHPQFSTGGPEGAERNAFEAQKAFRVEPEPAGKNDGA